MIFLNWIDKLCVMCRFGILFYVEEVIVIGWSLMEVCKLDVGMFLIRFFLMGCRLLLVVVVKVWWSMFLLMVVVFMICYFFIKYDGFIFLLKIFEFIFFKEFLCIFKDDLVFDCYVCGMCVNVFWMI